MMVKCPKCEHKFKPVNKAQPVNDYQIAKMMESKTKAYTALVKDIISRVRRNIPSDNNKESIMSFVSKISDYKYEAIKKAYNMYVNKGYFWQGKGFNYFIKMVDTVEEDWLKYAEIQKKKFGTTPKIIDWRNNAKSENSKINTKEKNINSRRSQRIN